MPPFKDHDRGFNGDMYKALEEIGHGAQIAVVDPSYDIPPEAQIVNYQGDSSAGALSGILNLVPTETDKVIIMAPDAPQTTCDAFEESSRVVDELGMSWVGLRRLSDFTPGGTELDRKGFYQVANDPEVHTLFVRTRDEKAYACAMFTVGHSQF